MNMQKYCNAAKKSVMPHLVRPMMAKIAPEPFDSPDWIFEIKWDGYRAMAETRKGAVDLYSRNLQPFNTLFPAIYEELKTINHHAILDGEIVALDSSGRSSFQYLQDFILNQNQTIVYYVFDILYLDGFDLTSLPLENRKQILKELVSDYRLIKYSDHIEEWGIDFFEIAKKENLEGIIAKNKKSLYSIGARSSSWLKIKAISQEEAIICGYTEPKGGRKYFGSLILGAYHDKNLVYLGNVGTGFSDSMIKDLYFKMQKLIQKKSSLENPPKLKAVWIKPVLVCEVKFAEITKEGFFRQPVFLGLREDKIPSEVVR